MKEKGWTAFATVWATVTWVFWIIGAFYYLPDTPNIVAHFLGGVFAIDAVFWTIIAWVKWNE